MGNAARQAREREKPEIQGMWQSVGGWERARCEICGKGMCRLHHCPLKGMGGTTQDYKASRSPHKWPCPEGTEPYHYHILCQTCHSREAHGVTV